VQRVATQNAVACKLLAAISVRAAAAAATAGVPVAAAGSEAAAAAAKPPFQASFDFRAALASSSAQFYPAIVLKH